MDLLSTIAILLVFAAIFGVLNERYLGLQSTIGLMLLALLTAVVGTILKATGLLENLGWEDALVSQLDISEVLLNGVLCFMLFAGSAGVKVEGLKENKWTVVSLAIGATLLACALIGVFLHLTLGWFGITLALTYAFVFGALISPTDPIAALAILKSVGLPKPLEDIINGESLFNDGVGVVLFTVAMAFAVGSSSMGVGESVGLFLREVLGGITLGLAVGAVSHFLLLRTEDFTNQLMITLAMVSLGYSIALHVDVSGPIAMVVAGILVGNVTAPRIPDKVRDPLRTFWSGIDDLLNSLLFVMLGFVIVLIHNLDWAPLAISIPVAIAVCLVARAISVYLPLVVLCSTPALNADPNRMTALLTWGGLRGGLAFALVLSLPDSPEKPLLVNMTYGVVAFSILLQGSTIGKLFKPAFLNSILKK
ncbi:MAG: sodium:proton antiporter [Xanthomonadales bacterium]|nr:sodium:proton antiporter [Xanthomonadales bacterium]MDH3924887.1 sodium:proton antiporter [Xanthomonadales bacterium]MDH4002749.1 sodium:proton antiporter [Xanthomonadales bacterium]